MHISQFRCFLLILSIKFEKRNTKSIKKMSRPVKYMINFQNTRCYSKRVKNILRNRYPHRNSDGSYIEYNESITIIPKEFEKQGLI